jgi:sugar phosphate isomerase/epimerase
MQLGAMNHPMRDPISEIETFARMGFEFVDLSLEPSAAYAKSIDVRSIRRLLDRHEMGVVGHTAWYLPLASNFASLRETALREMEICARTFHELGVRKMNVHPQTDVPLADDNWVRDQNIASLSRLIDITDQLGIKLMLENPPRRYNRAIELRPIFDAVPGLGFHLDVGHANLATPYNRTQELAANFIDRLEHIHVSDNKGGDDDLHLPLGVGNINWRWVVAVLKNAGYDGTITVEVFSEDEDYLVMSMNKLRTLWQEVPMGEHVPPPEQSRHV